MQTKTRIVHKKSGIKMSDMWVIKTKPTANKQTTPKEKKS